MKRFSSAFVCLWVVPAITLADGETTNLRESEPARLKLLHGKLKAWHAAVGADPMRPNPEYAAAQP